MALACVGRAYPYQLAHALDDDGDALPPRRLHPVFWGCYDWHSAVHGHWTLAAFARRFPGHARAAEVRRALSASFTAEGLDGERRYLERRPGFERPYGLAWLCALHAELAGWAEAADTSDGPFIPSEPRPRGESRDGDAEVATWAALVDPLAALSAQRVVAWLERLSFPTRVGTHAQSAFGAGLVLDWARARGVDDVASRIASAARRLHDGDRGPALHLEPSGEDFLSPALGAADLMRRVLGPDELASWLDRALPELSSEVPLVPAQPSDRRDGKLVHLDGLNASRAWMLASVGRALPADDPRRASLARAADEHARAALDALDGQHYAGAHWLGTFALYARLTLTT